MQVVHLYDVLNINVHVVHLAMAWWCDKAYQSVLMGFAELP